MITIADGKNNDWAGMSLEDLAYGNSMDADFTLRLFKVMKPEADATGVYLVYEKVLQDALSILSEVEFFGIKIDDQVVADLDVKLQSELKDLEVLIQEASPVKPINISSNADLIRVLFTSEGFSEKAFKRTKKTKAPSTKEDHLLMVKHAAKNNKTAPFIDLVLAYKERAKQHKTYVMGVKAAVAYNGESRVYSNYNFGDVVTGRLSCSKYSVNDDAKGISFHTLPRKTGVNIRAMMRADGDMYFITADFSQMELRILAQCSRDENLLKAFNSGEDLHSFTASLVFGKPTYQVTEEERQIAKSVSFLIVYGGGPRKLAEQIGQSMEYCKGIFDTYESLFPRVFKWIEQVHKGVQKNKHATSLFGRRRHLKNIDSPNKFYQYRAQRQGMNFVIQSSASDIMLHSIIQLVRKIKLRGLNAQMLATVHDSVELQCSEKDLDAVLQLVRETLTSTKELKRAIGLDFIVPFVVDIEVGRSFGFGVRAKFDSGKISNLPQIIKENEAS